MQARRSQVDRKSQDSYDVTYTWAMKNLKMRMPIAWVNPIDFDTNPGEYLAHKYAFLDAIEDFNPETDLER